ncbi:MAG: MoaD/ThiS family protein [Candidatus Heimdallarchaeota archaeon]|nr:MoaD/ThiS family protein [Candidatus Heimdallarchaeota archaeon]
MEKQISVSVKVYATLREYMTPKPKLGEPIILEMPESALIEDVVIKLGLPVDEVTIIFMNHQHVKLHDQLIPGASIGLFPPVGGG